jgi:hypothetical protein
MFDGLSCILWVQRIGFWTTLHTRPYSFHAAALLWPKAEAVWDVTSVVGMTINDSRLG